MTTPERPAKTPKVLVTPRSLTRTGLSAAVFDQLRAAGAELVAGPAGRQPSKAELLELTPGVTHWLAGVEPIDDDVLAAARDLRVISRYGVGVDGIDLAAAERRGVTVERTVGANARAVAELALAQILNGLRGTAPAARALAAGRWAASPGRELPECIIGLVGLGAVGTLVADFATALGAKVVATDPWAEAGSWQGRADRLETLAEVLAVSDAVSLHCPAPRDGRPIIGARELALTPPGTVLVNTARSALVDDAAVLAALESGQLSSYAVDAFDAEPPPPSPLLAHPKVIATPHLGGQTAAAGRRMAELAVANIIKHLGTP
ncbi:MAG: hypothetical protein LBD77_05105 [Bifidobacteriaceae bacterium]|jgi:D-3-phosphoglycerate dehydrogenase|nr:hypothetical protein [Bifidobacteriaceae bacterium]